MFVCDGLPWLQLPIQLVIVGHRQPGLTIWTVHQPTVECRPACEVYLTRTQVRELGPRD